MSDSIDQNNDSAPSPTDAIEGLTKDAAFTALCASTAVSNKTAVFDALAAAGITIVVVQFDGYGDSGQIEDIEARTGDEPANFPAGAVDIAHARWGSAEVERTTESLRSAIETLAYDFLGQTYGSWEDGEGGFGEFTFDVAARTITLDYNERIETSEHTQTVF